MGGINVNARTKKTVSDPQFHFNFFVCKIEKLVDDRVLNMNTTCTRNIRRLRARYDSLSKFCRQSATSNILCPRDPTIFNRFARRVCTATVRRKAHISDFTTTNLLPRPLLRRGKRIIRIRKLFQHKRIIHSNAQAVGDINVLARNFPPDLPAHRSGNGKLNAMLVCLLPLFCQFDPCISAQANEVFF